MFQRLKQKWKVNGTQLFLILCVFAITGTTTAWLTRQVTLWLYLTSASPWYWVLKIIILVFGYQVLILLFAIPFGQFSFFWKYEKKILMRMGLIGNGQSAAGNRQSAIGSRQLAAGSQAPELNALHDTNNSETVKPPHTGNQQPATGNQQSAVGFEPEKGRPDDTLNMKSDTNYPQQNSEPQTTNHKPQTVNIAIFASGAGSNAQKLIDYFRHHEHIKIVLIVCNKPGAGVLTIAQKENVPSLIIEKEKFFRGNAYVDELRQFNVDFIVLAGFLWKVPVALIQAYQQRIINIHPALLPNYGGKGMYGMFVHEAVIAAGEKESGISIHYVDELYDHGQLIFQARCAIEAADTPDSLAQKIHALEHEHFPLVVEKVISKLQNRR